MVPSAKYICVVIFGLAVFSSVASLGRYLMGEVPPKASGKRPVPTVGHVLNVPAKLQDATIVYMGGCGGCQRDPVNWSRVKPVAKVNLHFLYDGHPAAFSDLPTSERFLFSHASPYLRILTNSWYPRAFKLRNGEIYDAQRSPDDVSLIKVVAK
ncbi:MAG TPA: hypothetical protein PKA27_15540 [Fimbriimonadaceae bacterium]|nr:hypothetical protein [Fimbriimonadaceae bacterium]